MTFLDFVLLLLLPPLGYFLLSRLTQSGPSETMVRCRTCGQRLPSFVFHTTHTPCPERPR